MSPDCGHALRAGVINLLNIYCFASIVIKETLCHELIWYCDLKDSYSAIAGNFDLGIARGLHFAKPTIIYFNVTTRYKILHSMLRIETA